MTVPRFSDALGHGMSDKRIDILRGIGRTGSISQAARDARVSYKAAWQAIATLTNLAGVPLVERSVGGAGGGGAVLTGEGRQLLELADAHEVARRAVQTVGTASTAMARLSIRTSMRNQLPATVSALERAGRVVRVRMSLPGGDGIAARITQESAELLGLAEGMAAIALCKATAVRVERADAAAQLHAQPLGNQLGGTVARIARERDSDSGDEVVVTLAGGVQVVGFAAGGSALRTRQRVTAVVDEAAVVVALPG
ncbi:TOBE domain-containing protein [Variovorax sp. dw_308]|uniref:TOBE domain-containing protein n=1 Tax=Variovorax sp. dw_308 TaxID=2721546 RepID=UPI001C43D95E|nr:TOBE domain-containing protein [Variovorax sp. dw_308]